MMICRRTKLIGATAAFGAPAQEVLDIGLADSLYVLPRLKLTSRAPVPSARRAPKIPKGQNPFYQLIQTDLLGGGGREGNASSVEDYHAYTVVPARYGSESEYRAKLIKLIKRRAKPYPGFAQDCEKLLACPCSEQTQFEWGQSEIGDGSWMTQWEQQRLYLFDRDLNPVGFIELTQTLSASSDAPDGNELELRVHEAWAIPDAWTLLSDIAATSFSGTVAQVFVSWRPTQPQPLGLTLISDSEFLLSRNFLGDVADLAADQLEISREKIDIGYDV